MDTTGGMGAAEASGHEPYDVFISYSHRDNDEKGYARDLATWLEGQGYTVWWDRDLLVGDNWHELITVKMQAARRIVAMFSKRSLTRPLCQYEALFASGARKLLPLAIEDLVKADFPEELGGLVYGLNRIDWRAPDAKENLRKKLDLTPSGTPQAAAAAGADPSRIFISNLPTGAGRLIGRDVELSRLATAWASTAPGADPAKKSNLVLLHAIGGAGKTALMREFLNELANQGWARADKVYGWSAYSQGSGEDRNVDADGFLTEALAHFGHDFEKFPLGDSLAKGRALARLVAKGRNLLVIDGLEPLQHPPNAITAGDEGNKNVVQRSGAIKDKGVARLIRDLATSNQGLVLITSRQEIVELESTPPRVVIHALEQLNDKAGAELLRAAGVWGAQGELEKAAHSVEGHALSLSLLGTYLSAVHGGDVRKRDHFDFETAVVGAAREGDRKAKRAQHVMEKYVERLSELSGTAGEGAIEVMILRLLGLFDRPAEMEALKAVLAEPAIPGLTEAWHAAGAAERWSRWGWAVTRLRALKLLNAEDKANPGALDAHPVVREHFSRELATRAPAAFRAAHGRLYDFYRYRGLPGEFQEPIAYAALGIVAAFPENRNGNQRALAAGRDPGGGIPTTLKTCSADDRKRAAEIINRADFAAALAAFLPEDEAGMQPCFQAIAHGCTAGRQTEAFAEVYRPRVARGNANFAATKLGLYGAELAALASFFDVPFATPSPNLSPERQALVLNLSGFRLRAIGRLAEAVAPFRAYVDATVRDENWKHAAAAASNLSELLLTLGRVPEAAAAGADSVTYADRSGDAFEAMSKRTTHADALAQAGDLPAAAALFAEAEAMQAKRQPSLPRLYSLRGYQSCDVLLAQGRAGDVAGRYDWLVSVRMDGDSLLDRGLEELLGGRAHTALAMAAAGPLSPVVITSGATPSGVIPGERSETRDPGAANSTPSPNTPGAPSAASPASGTAAAGDPGSRLAGSQGRPLGRDDTSGSAPSVAHQQPGGSSSAPSVAHQQPARGPGTATPALLPPTAAHHAALAERHLDDAVARLIKANSDDRTPWGLIARAAFRRWRLAATGDRAALTAADDDLRDAETIARQDEPNGGAMRLHLTDIALERCRLALVQAGIALPVPPVVDAPWAKEGGGGGEAGGVEGASPVLPEAGQQTASDAAQRKGWFARMLSVFGSERATPPTVIPGERSETRDPGATPSAPTPHTPGAPPAPNAAAGGPGSRLAGSQGRPLGRDDNTESAPSVAHQQPGGSSSAPSVAHQQPARASDHAEFLALAGRHWSAAADLVKATGYHRVDGDLAELRAILDREMRG